MAREIEMRVAYTRRGLALLATLMLCACQPATSTKESTMDSNGREIVHLSISAYNYLARPLVEIRLNGKDVGGGGGSVITGVAVPLGLQVVTWRLDGPEGMAGNGDTVQAVNQPVLVRPDPKIRYLGVHIYPDNTVEVIPEEFWPEMTERGKALREQRWRQHGQ